MIALLDESVHVTPRGLHYVIAAAIVLRDESDKCRDRVLECLAGRERAFHWSREGVEKRSAMIEAMCELNVMVVAGVHEPVRRTRQRQARHTLMLALLGDLAREGVTELVIEGRDATLDGHDRQTVIDAQHLAVVPEDFVYRFETKAEPLLWLPDAAVGALAAAEVGKANEYLVRLGTAVLNVHRLGP